MAVSTTQHINEVTQGKALKQMSMGGKMDMKNDVLHKRIKLGDIQYHVCTHAFTTSNTYEATTPWCK